MKFFTKNAATYITGITIFATTTSLLNQKKQTQLPLTEKKETDSGAHLVIKSNHSI